MTEQQGLLVTLAEAQASVFADLSKEKKCPCCGRRVRADKRSIHDEMVRFLARLVGRYYRDSKVWHHVRDVVGRHVPKSSTDGAYLVHWGLVESKPKQRGEKSSGYYRATSRGAAFIEGRSLEAAWCRVFNGRPVLWAEEMVSVSDVWGRAFDYDAVVRG